MNSEAGAVPLPVPAAPGGGVGAPARQAPQPGAAAAPPGAHAAAAPAASAASGRARGARRGIAALISGGSRPQLPDALEPVVRAHRARHPEVGRADVALLGRAYQVAEASHRGQKRKSGEPFITHPLAVTMILAQLGAGTTTLVASLLHDTVEDTEMTLTQVRESFGPEVAYLVDGVTKLEKVDFGAAAEAETFRKMLVATGDDVRVMVIKLADRLHNMRTLRHMKPASQIRIATVTRDVLIPLAERLGIQVVKTELEDLVFATLHPQEYAQTRALLERAAGRPAGGLGAAAADAAGDAARVGAPPRPAQAPEVLAAFAARLRRQLREARIPAEVEVRPRHVVSVHRVRLARGAGGELGPGDLARVLVVAEESADCYAVLGELHTCWSPVPGEFRDFIAAPKFNLYQSLHTAVALGDGAGTVEVLVRSARMHEVAEYGVVALDAVPMRAGSASAGSASGGSASGGESGGGEEDELDRTDPARPGWLERLLEWQRRTPDPDTFWSRLTEDLSGDQDVTVFTPHGRAVDLPSGADCVDFAYALGEEIGHRCIGARINGRLVALSTRPAEGDVVEVLTEPGRGEPSGPSRSWLRHARTPLARMAIERWFLRDRPAAGSRPRAEPEREPGLGREARPEPGRGSAPEPAPERGYGRAPGAAGPAGRTGGADAAGGVPGGDGADAVPGGRPAVAAEGPEAADDGGAAAVIGRGAAPAPGEGSRGGAAQVSGEPAGGPGGVPTAAVTGPGAGGGGAAAVSGGDAGPDRDSRGGADSGGRAGAPTGGAVLRPGRRSPVGRTGGAGAGSGSAAGPRSAGEMISVPGRPHAPVRLARCCTPVPPDALVGFAIRGGAVAAHRADCPVAAGMLSGGRKPLGAGWREPGERTDAPAAYRATVNVEALGRPRLIAELTDAMSGAGVDILSAVVEPPRELRVRHTYTVALPGAGALPELMRAMMRVPGVYDVYRAHRAGDARAAGETAEPGRPGDTAIGGGNGSDRAVPRVRPSVAVGIRGRSAAFSPDV